MGPVQQALRRTFTAPVTLHTLGQGKEFALADVDREGIVLLLGRNRARTRLSWECLESIPVFLRGQVRWVPAGGARSVAGEPGTLDEHLKRYLKRDVARWLVRLLLDANVVQIAQGAPLRLRVSESFGR